MRSRVVIVLAVAALCMARASAAPDRRIAQLVRTEFAATSIPGMAMAVFEDGLPLYEGGAGYADVAARIPAGARTRFAIGSLTKEFTAVSVLMLAQQGRLSLSDRLAKFFPAFPNAQSITLRELLNQTSGLHNYPYLGEHPWPASGPISNAALLKFLQTDKPDFAPGTQWGYSNANYAVLAGIIEKVSGESYGQFLNRSIFGPLHMSQSGYGYAAQQIGGVATPYEAAMPVRTPLSLDLYSGAGGIVSSAHDLLLWDRALLAGSLLQPKYRHELFAAGSLADGQPVHYAMGFVPDTLYGHRLIWHNGYVPGASGYCYNALLPDDGLAFVVLTNGDPATAAGFPERLVRDIFAQRNPAAPNVPENLAVTRLAKAWLRELMAGTIDRAQLDPSFSARVSDAMVARVKTALAALGTPSAFVFAGARPQGSAMLYEYRVAFSGGAGKMWDVAIVSGKIAGSRLY